MLTFIKMTFPVELRVQMDILTNISGVVTQPCISDGGSPFRYHDSPRVTDVIFTGQNRGASAYCSMTSKKSMTHWHLILRRVDYFSTMNSSKGFSATPLTFSLALSHVTSFIIQARLSCDRLFLALRSGSVRYV